MAISSLRRIVRFMTVGLTASALYFSLIWALKIAIGASTMVATSTAFVVVVVSNYFMHYCWTFNSNKKHHVASLQFVATSLLGFALNFFTLYVGVVIGHLSWLPTQFFAIALVVGSNYILSSYWVFQPFNSSSVQK
jgi:putative flippase GtrA